MNIDSEMVKRKDIAGTTAEGKPIIFIETHGGLYAFFAKKDSSIKALGVGAHLAIAQFMAEKQEPGIVWAEEFILKSEEVVNSLQKNDQQVRIKKLIFSVDINDSKEPSDIFFVYHMPTRIPTVMKKEKMDKYIEKGFIDESFLVRDANLTTIALPVSDHPSFAGVKNE